eukprot:CAMPEP_0170275646 /NCGR_PEP_ID=MMETSP0116_2-20130129/37805_1 /TAXON_ID=400756 /ORGANISM="Durinskia baltica, Strain CSIRO CS-38" /LENGTH=599 /DNA_ID=CAMNT_0010526913 /DNA_START=45 /DNA_END=1844 /DNA_ORIENTATION=+
MALRSVNEPYALRPLLSAAPAALACFLRFANVSVAAADYFPFKGHHPMYPMNDSETSNGLEFAWHSGKWQPPLMQPWDALRATSTSVTVAWTPAWNPWCDVDHYDLQVRTPSGHPLVLADSLGLQLREADTQVDMPFEDHSPWAEELWTPWQTEYNGRARVFARRVELGTAHAVQFRVRACGRHHSDGCSAWSPVQTTHTVLSAMQDRINFHVRGTGKNAHNYTIIEVNRRIIYQRRDETGLVLAIFSRLDFSLHWLRTYDTQRNRTEGVQMATDVRMFNQSFFIVVVSAIAWEWHAPHILVKTLEFCGAYHFGQWANIFAEHGHYVSNASDLQQDASQDEFGHPFALIGIPGIGAGNGWESLMHNTGQYLPRGVRPQDAVIRGVAYYDYVHRLFRIQDIFNTKATFYAKGVRPPPESLHNPTPAHKNSIDELKYPIPAARPTHVPYIGTLANKIFHIIEANETVPPYNFAFVLVTTAKVRYVDPRPREMWVTEVERVWDGPSARYWPHNGTFLQPGLDISERSCAEFITQTFQFASPELCGMNFESCCTEIDAPGSLATACGAGISPTLCKHSIGVQLEDAGLSQKWPYEFRIIDWES